MYYNEVLAISANHYQSYGNIGICYIKLGLKQEALDAFDEAIRINPEYELAVVNRAIIEKLAEGENWNKVAVGITDYAKEYTLKKALR
jgi:tetratricopeptide (TPR) repeat protein